MFNYRTARFRFMLKTVIVSWLLFLGIQSVLAQKMVSVLGPTANMRAGPGTSADVQWTLESGYPLQVIGRRGTWLKVRDFEGDQGWVARRLTGPTPHYVVKSPRANLRSGPGSQYRLVGQASRGEVFRTVEKRSSWVRVAGEDGRKGWVALRLLWGW